MDCGSLRLDAQKRRLVLTAAGHRGFTLIEMMIGLAIFALLIGMAVPSFTVFLANSKVRYAAEALQSGLAIARSEALRRNQNVEFILTDDVIDGASVGAITPSTTGRSWVVRVLDTTGTYQLIQAKSGAEGSGQVEGGVTVQVGGSVSQVTFKGLGGTQGLGAMASFDFSNPSFGACNTTGTPGPIRCLRVQVSVAGQVRLCDPSTVAPDTRAC